MTYEIKCELHTHYDFYTSLCDSHINDVEFFNYHTNSLLEAAEYLHCLYVAFRVTPKAYYVLRQLLDLVNKAEQALYNDKINSYCTSLGGRYEGSYISVRKVK